MFVTSLVLLLAGIAFHQLTTFGRGVPWATAGTGETWEQLHARTYARTVIIVPRIGDRPRPNLEHMILHALLLAAGICCLVYAAR